MPSKKTGNFFYGRMFDVRPFCGIVFRKRTACNESEQVNEQKTCYGIKAFIAMVGLPSSFHALSAYLLQLRAPSGSQ